MTDKAEEPGPLPAVSHAGTAGFVHFTFWSASLVSPRAGRWPLTPAGTGDGSVRLFEQVTATAGCRGWATHRLLRGGGY